MFWNEIGGILGCMISGWMVDQLPLFTKRISALCALTTLTCTFALYIFPLSSFLEVSPIKSQYTILLARVSMFLAGAGINGPKTLLSMAVRESVPDSLTGTIGM